MEIVAIAWPKRNPFARRLRLPSLLFPFTVAWGVVVGTLTLDYRDELVFTYSQSWLERMDARPISASLLLRPEAFGLEEALPYFEGLLPEGMQRVTIINNLRTPKDYVFYLIEALGGETAGALEFLPNGKVSEASEQPTTAFSALTTEELDSLIQQCQSDPMLASSRGDLRLSLAGAQSKLPVNKVNDGIALPVAGLPTSHILKPQIPRYGGITENEALCMRLASAIGLDAARIEYATTGKTPYILVERFDRVRSKSGRQKRLHQEDFCQAMGMTSDVKYAEHGGPELWDCMNLLRWTATVPLMELPKLLDAAVYNAVIGNADAHAKNFSLLYHPDRTTLTPLYDLLSTAIYPTLSPRFAMRIGNCWTLGEMDPPGWRKFAEDIDLSHKLVVERVHTIANAARTKVDGTLRNLELPRERRRFGEEVSTAIKERAEVILRSTGME